MYPQQTSLIPVTVTLVNYLTEHGLEAFGKIYPNWYLGADFKYLSGPVTVLFSYLTKKILPWFSVFDITIFIALLSVILGSVLWSVFTVKIFKIKKRVLKILITILFFTFPWKYYSALVFDDVSMIAVRNFIPLLLLLSDYHVRENNIKSKTLIVLGFAFMLFVNIQGMPIYIVSLFSLMVYFGYKNERISNLFTNFKLFVPYLLFGFLLTFLWYGMEFWLIVFANPSIGGASLGKVFVNVINFARSYVPVVLAIIVVYFSKKFNSRGKVFAAGYFLSFLALSIFRFIADWDFWQDWSAWFCELETGLVFLITAFLVTDNKPVNAGKRMIVGLIMILMPWYVVFRVNLSLGYKTVLSNKLPESVADLGYLHSVAKDQRVFVSGSDVFWLNSLYPDILQVRGGSDQASKHPFWDHAAYQIREGDDPVLTRLWLETLGVRYVLVRSEYSKEYYKDFKNLQKWNDVGKIILEKNGDFMVEYDKSCLGWEVKEFSDISPTSGNDAVSLKDYLSNKLRCLDSHYDNNRLIVDTQEAKNIILTVNRFSSIRGEYALAIFDGLGNLNITNVKSGQIVIYF